MGECGTSLCLSFRLVDDPFKERRDQQQKRDGKMEGELDLLRSVNLFTRGSPYDVRCVVPIGNNRVLCLTFHPASDQSPLDTLQCWVCLVGQDSVDIEESFPCPLPPNMQSPTYTRVGSHVCVFGAISSEYGSDLWVLSLDTLKWRQVTKPAQSAFGRLIRREWPGERTHHLAMCVGDRLVITGGWVGTWIGSRHLRDCWAYDPDTDAWTRLPNCPANLTSGCTVPMGDGETVMMLGCGGEDSDYDSYTPRSAAYTFSLDGGFVSLGSHERTSYCSVASRTGRYVFVTGGKYLQRKVSVLDTVSMDWLSDFSCETPGRLSRGLFCMCSPDTGVCWSNQGEIHLMDMYVDQDVD
ncbi:hypothetical protein KIPB_003202 [Kipferlia bialata]|uniref:Kelch repeat type 1 n=1 Tax=Kipferlia bialata TaxID=797122 RepID=A0A9K3CTQ2_9EUKA|nr:hypothetical protein KIPB_003202 [Kipferlia bialata]|eukprot:g3202.t1